ncbi:hypothetical protein IMG5_133250 [Ichthyophthirius multifiliis]|uniref:THO complex subunitTHOC2 C-terminal domain-containing protein n=1 Tax=Ichthyophthirius multifiliis TaxID=5932 RepID=G0QWL3_ICHMU|nr:hypothetical protein IMG5_133250 [Ichthyophthirius multifiliis]EGR30388.1 hypothetical protein IMG5_133250 [Ichthyophthirius multifiliis]|eukprot:XP_004031975.1 hypothetical protein IMG5_133250 [Ichthyophthirius multifiliis]
MILQTTKLGLQVIMSTWKQKQRRRIRIRNKIIKNRKQITKRIMGYNQARIILYFLDAFFRKYQYKLRSIQSTNSRNKRQYKQKMARKNKKEKDKPKELRDQESILKKLETELEIYTKRYEQYELYIQSIKPKLYIDFKEKDNFITQFSQSCILPRMVIEQNEAMYCSRFFLCLLRINYAPLSDSVRSIKQIVMKILPYIQCATEKEAINISILLMTFLDHFLIIWMASILDKMFKVIQQMTKNEIQVRNILTLLNVIKNIYPKYKHQCQECKVLMDQLEKQFSKETYKSLTIRIEGYQLFLGSLKNLTDAPTKQKEQEKKNITNPSTENLKSSHRSSVEKYKKEHEKKEKLQSREKSSDKTSKRDGESRNKKQREDRK